MENTKNTKIVCTIGPSSWDPEIITKMIKEGMNVARINGAFADIAELKRVATIIRNVSKDIALMLDIKGHEIRLNKFSEKIHVTTGQEVVIGSSTTDRLFPMTYLNLYKDIEAGQTLIIDKGAVFMKVTKIENKNIYCKVTSGELIESGKGMNIPGSRLNNPSLTEIDIEQIRFVVQDDWDFVAGSFIRNTKDIDDIKKILGQSKIKIISKIEDQQGIDNISFIIEASDGIMIARGDMGTEIPYERLPILQKEIIYKCNLAAKPVIVATNMLESMIEKSMPTRAEITDVSNAVLDGTDAIMTSGETSTGKYPVETLITMTRICKESEKYLIPEILKSVGLNESKISVAISNAAFEFILEMEDITKILIYSRKGKIPRIIARLNLPTQIIALVNNETLKRQLNLTKNVTSYVFDKDYTDRDVAIKGIIEFGLENKVLTKEDKILLIGNLNFKYQGKDVRSSIFEFRDISCDL